MPVIGTPPVGELTPTYQGPTRTPQQSLNPDMFMKLLVTQLQNQDPSSPMDTNQMMAQQTQLAMMEQLTALATTSEENFSLGMRSVAAELLGKTVSYTDPDGVEKSGVADSVSYAGPVPMVSINGIDVPLDAVSSVLAQSSL